MAGVNATELAALLRWYEAVGVDEAIALAPAARTAMPAPAARGGRPGAERADTPRAGGPAARPSPAPRAGADAGPDRGPGAAAGAADPGAAGDARGLAAACNDLEALRAALERFEGCRLRDTATQLVFADGNPKADLMIVGEAPGAEEDRRGLPFVGRAGQLLDRMLAAIGRDRSSAYITNIVVWRPPGNRKPTPAEIAVCLPFAERHIALVAPKVLVLAGGTAAGALLDTNQGITRLRGRWVEQGVPGLAAPVPTMPTFHPAFLLRNAAAKRQAWRDLLAVETRLAGGA